MREEKGEKAEGTEEVEQSGVQKKRENDYTDSSAEIVEQQRTTNNNKQDIPCLAGPARS